MRSRSLRTLALCTAMLALAIATCANISHAQGPDRFRPTAGDFPKFDWGAGDSWNYSYSYDYQDVHQLGKYMFWIESVDAVTTVMRFDGNGSISWDTPPGNGTWHETGSRVFHTPTLAISSNRASMTIEFTQPEPHHEETLMITNNTPAYDIYSFPIAEGEKWMTSIVGNDYYYIILDGKYYDLSGNIVSGPQRRTIYHEFEHHDSNETQLNISGKVIDTRVVHTENDTRVAYLSSEIGNEARVDRYDEKGAHISRMEVADWIKAPRVMSKLKVYVENWIGQPLSDAIVELSNGVSGSTNDNGMFETKVYNGNYTVEVSKKGFEVWRTELLVNGDASLSVRLDAPGRATALWASIAGAILLTGIGIVVVSADRRPKT